MTESRKVVYLTCPSYAGDMRAATARALFVDPMCSDRKARIDAQCGSLLAHNFNELWANALNKQADGEQIDYFAMLHNDIEPDAGWLDTLIRVMEEGPFDMVSAVVPIKDQRGLTSTAVAHESGDPWKLDYRLTLKEAHALPETFTAADLGCPDRPLLVNSGCWVCRFDPEWTHQTDAEGNLLFHFEIRNRIRPVRGKNGKTTFKAEVIPEDWLASRFLHKLGLRVAATRAVRLLHAGTYRFSNYEAWGWDCDKNHVKESRVRPAEVVA